MDNRNTYDDEHIALWRNTMTGEVGNYNHWKRWAERFYASLTHDEMGRDVEVLKGIGRGIDLMPEDWWERTQRVLKLEAIGPSRH